MKKVANKLKASWNIKFFSLEADYRYIYFKI